LSVSGWVQNGALVIVPLIKSLLAEKWVPFSARATVIFALVGTYLGSGWVVSIYVFDLVVIGLTGRIISNRLKTVGLGFIMDIPPYRLPHLKHLIKKTWYSRASQCW